MDFYDIQTTFSVKSETLYIANMTNVHLPV